LPFNGVLYAGVSMKMFSNKTIIIAFMFFGLGVTLIIAENTFYQFIDNGGVLHESMFMPLGVISIAVGVLFLMFFIIQKILYSFHKK
jgi:hypothetical protein